MDVRVPARHPKFKFLEFQELDEAPQNFCVSGLAVNVISKRKVNLTATLLAVELGAQDLRSGASTIVMDMVVDILWMARLVSIVFGHV